MMSFGGFPGVVRTDDSYPLTTIFGELYMVPYAGLSSLDMLESHPRWYERRKYRTDVMDRRAWMYTLPNKDRYLDAKAYTQIPSPCIWRPVPGEIKYWKDEVQLDEFQAHVVE